VNTVEPVTALLAALADALARQRQALEAGELSQLGALNVDLARAFDAIGAFGGGEGGLHQAITSLPAAERQALRTLLLQSEGDNLISGELIRITMHRVAAIQAFRAASSEAGTYGPGASGTDSGTRLSRRA
jgi:hypothetical protein